MDFGPRDEDLFHLREAPVDLTPRSRSRPRPLGPVLRAQLERLWERLDAQGSPLAAPSLLEKPVPAPRRAHVVSIRPRTTYRFVIPDAGQTVIPLRERIPVADWARAILVVRVHEVPSAADTTIDVVAQNMATSRQDPGVTFVAPTDSALVTFIGTEPLAGRMRLATLTGPIGPMQRVLLRVSGSKTPGVLELALSVDLVGRTA